MPKPKYGISEKEFNKLCRAIIRREIQLRTEHMDYSKINELSTDFCNKLEKKSSSDLSYIDMEVLDEIRERFNKKRNQTQLSH